MEASVYKEAEERRRKIGITYMELAEEANLSHTVIHQVLTERKSGLPMNRERILEWIVTAMDVLESAESNINLKK